MLRLRTLGGLAVERDDQTPLTGAAVQRRPLALLTLLAAAGSRGISRDRLLLLLWSESEPERARNVLKQTLYSLRRDLKAPELVLGTTELRLNPEVIEADLADFERALARGDLEAAVELYAGPFLDGFHLGGTPEFERWQDGERARLEHAFAEAAEALASSCAARGEHARAVALWRRIAAADPLSGRAAAGLMTALAAAGDRAAALRHGQIHEALLRSELDVGPEPQVAALLERLRVAEPPTPAAAPAVVVAAPAPSVVAVATAPPAAPVVELAEPDAPSVEAAPAAPPAAPAHPIPAPAPPRRRALRRWAIAAAVAAMAVGAPAIALSMRDEAPTLDRTRYVVMPFREAAGGRGAALDGEQAKRLVYLAMRKWNDVRLVDFRQVDNALVGDGAPRSLDDVVRATRALGARYVVWGETWQLGDTTYVDATLYDARDGAAVRQATLLAAAEKPFSGTFDRLAAELLVGATRARPAAGPGIGPPRVDAWAAYDTALAALERWDVREARRALERATTLAPDFAPALLDLARVMAWTDDPLPERRAVAERAATAGAQLSVRERAHAGALVSLAHGRFPDACRAYNALLALDSLDFEAWYGLGECHRLDSAVVPDPASPSGWRFRGSYHRAVQAYLRAFELVPSVHAIFRQLPPSRLSRLLFTETSRHRAGWSQEDPPAAFAAFPRLESDTLAFVPYRVGELFRRPEAMDAAATERALRRNRALLGGVVMRWVREYPRSADAYELLARVQESAAELRSANAGRIAAIEAVARARSLATEPEQRLRLALAAVRLSVKGGHFAEAGRLADSLLRATPARSHATARALAGLAVLLGRPAESARHLAGVASGWRFAGSDGRVISPPEQVGAVALALLAHASVGATPDTIRALDARVQRLVGSYFAGAEAQELARDALLAPPATLGFAAAGTLGGHRSRAATPWLVMQRAVARGEMAAARRELAALDSARGALLPGDVTLDMGLQEAHILLALGDTAAAAARLDRSLDALPKQPLFLLDHVPLAAAIPRAMALRGEIATRRGETAAARRWSAAVAELWGRGEPATGAQAAALAARAGPARP